MPTACGFALVEFIVAIVLLGVIFLFTLRGAEIITSMRAVVAGREIQQIQAKVETYRANFFGALPGDDTRAQRLFLRQPAMSRLGQILVDLTGNGRIDGMLSDFSSPDGEQFMAWRDLRYAGMLDGDPKFQGAAAMPDNPFGGVYGFDEGNLGLADTTLCATRVPGRAAQMIDAQLDDGGISTGKVVGTAKVSVQDYNHFPAPDPEPYAVEKEYIICTALLP